MALRGLDRKGFGCGDVDRVSHVFRDGRLVRIGATFRRHFHSLVAVPSSTPTLQLPLPTSSTFAFLHTTRYILREHINTQAPLLRINHEMPPSAGTYTTIPRVGSRRLTWSTGATQDTPLAPSVEKAYYRKCIELKRRLNEVEASNDEAKKKRMRLDRAIMKMRLERAFLLDELRKRMDVNIDGSDGSGDEELERPPPDRPHRDKRRRQQAPQPTAPSTGTFQAYAPAQQRTGSDPSLATIPGGAGPVADDGRYAHMEPGTPQASGSAPLPHGSPYGQPPTGMPSGAVHHTNGASYEDEATGEPVNGDAATN